MRHLVWSITLLWESCCCSCAHRPWAHQPTQGGCERGFTEDTEYPFRHSGHADTDGCSSVTEYLYRCCPQAGGNDQSQEPAWTQPVPSSSSIHDQEDRDYGRHQTKVSHSVADGETTFWKGDHSPSFWKRGPPLLSSLPFSFPPHFLFTTPVFPFVLFLSHFSLCSHPSPLLCLRPSRFFHLGNPWSGVSSQSGTTNAIWRS